MQAAQTNSSDKLKKRLSVKLDLACGKHKKPGFVGVDFSPDCDADVVLDLTKYPWPWADGSVAEIYSAHFFEHLNGRQRIDFMHEIYRVLRPSGKAVLVTPYWSSHGAIQDPTHEWPPICEMSYAYFDRHFRESNGIDHYPIHCDFEVQIGVRYFPEWQDKSAEEKRYAMRCLNNVVLELSAILSKR